MSGWRLSIWPNLIQVVPSSLKAPRSRCPEVKGCEIRIRDPGNKRGARSGVDSGCGVIGQPSEPVPGEDVSNLLDAIPVMEEQTSNVI